MRSNETINWICECSKIWNLLITDNGIHMSNDPKGRRAGHCYCGKELMQLWENKKECKNNNKKFYQAIDKEMLYRSRCEFNKFVK